MPSKRRPPKGQQTRFTIAVSGDGIGLKDVDLRQLAQLLEGTASFFENVALERGLEPPKLSLAKAKQGSAAYDIFSEDRSAKRVASAVASVVKKRGRGASPKTRNSMQRLFQTASKMGQLRFDPPDAKPDAKPIMLAKPVEDDHTQIEEGSVVYGRIVGLRLEGVDSGTVSIRYEDGGIGNFDASLDMIAKAAKVIIRNVPVRARVTFMRGEYRDFDGAIESIDERPASEVDFLTAINRMRDKLTDEGIVIDAKAWFAEEREP